MSESGRQQPRLSLVVAMSENHVIGRDGRLPWRLPDDLKRFKELTTGHTIIMGRKTFDSIGRPLPNRRNIVVTRQEGWSSQGVEVAHSLDEALTAARSDGEVFIIGGEQIYRAALPRADTIHLTRVHATVEGDAQFPPLEERCWECVEQINHPADARHAHAMTFEVHRRRNSQ